MADIHQIEFATRMSDDAAKQVEVAIIKLGSPEFPQRGAATAELLRLCEKACPALLGPSATLIATDQPRR